MINNLELWKEYKEKNNKEAREKLIKEYISIVKYQAGRVEIMLPDFIEKDDLESFGIIGLLDAIEKYDHKRGIEFSTYASKRIRGEIIDHLRSLDWLPHSMRREAKKIKREVEEYKNKNGKKPSIEELSKNLDISKTRINTIYYKLYTSQWVSLDQDFGDGESTIIDILKNKNTISPDKALENKKSINLLAQAIDKLDEKEKLVVSLYYYEELTQSEIAEIMDLSKARISQLHKKAIHRLRGFLSHKKEELV
ncbi:MAG: sigma-70 family RNA polymerase sigma factor [Bacillota bacterium]